LKQNLGCEIGLRERIDENGMADIIEAVRRRDLHLHP